MNHYYKANHRKAFVRGRQQLILDSRTRMIIGIVTGKEFKKEDQASSHLLQNPHGWACHVQSLRDAESAAAEYVVITDTKSGSVYKALIKDFWTKGKFVEREGKRTQCCLGLEHWTKQGSSRKRSSVRPLGSNTPIVF